jgi:ribosomal protein S13
MKINKKIKDLTKNELDEINKLIQNCYIISFDEEEIAEKRKLAVNLRMAAHETLLEADLLDDEIIKTLMGIKDDKSRKSKAIAKSGKGVAKCLKTKRLGKKV